MTQHTEHKADPKADLKNDVNDIFNQATENFKSAMDAGTRFQKDAVKAMTDCFGKGECMEDVRGQMETVATDSITMVRKNTESAQKFIDEGCKTGVEMLKKNFDVVKGQNGHANKDAFAQTRDVWQNAFDAMRTTVESAARTQVAAMETWSNFFTKTMVMTEKKASK